MKRFHLLSAGMATTMAVMLSLSACSSDNGGTGGSKEIEKTNVQGIIEKGPFVQGSKVTLYELNADLSQTGKSFKTQTNSDLGGFSFGVPMQLSSQYVELETSGYFYNEVKGDLSASQITLNALSDLSNRSTINVNLITHLEYERVKRLVSEGKSFSAAKAQAETELLTCFAITDKITSPEDVSITDNNKNSAILLAISTIMLYDKSEAEFSEFIAKFSTDFADNGQIDSDLLRTTIAEGEKHAHPSEVIEKMQQFYEQKGVTLQCDDFSRFIDFNCDGVIDEEDDEEEMNNIVLEPYFNSKNDFLTLLYACYSKCAEFETSQLKLEGLRTDDPKQVHSIKPQNVTLRDAYSAAYSVINYANTLLFYAPTTQNVSPEEMAPIIAQAKGLRAFAYYNLTMLWGNVILITEPSTIMEDYRLVPSTQAEVFQFAYSEICEAIANMPFSYLTELETKALLTRNAGLMLKAEIELSLGRDKDAEKTLNNVGEDVLFGFADTEQNILPIYTCNYLKLLQKEAIGDTEGIVQEWTTLNAPRYGYWAALKRLGKAQEVTGCFAYELLLPVPSDELRLNPSLRQNSGY